MVKFLIQIFLDKSSEYTQCLIKGNKEDVNFAVGIINHIKSYDDNSIKDIILFDDRNKFEVNDKYYIIIVFLKLEK